MKERLMYRPYFHFQAAWWYSCGTLEVVISIKTLGAYVPHIFLKRKQLASIYLVSPANTKWKLLSRNREPLVDSSSVGNDFHLYCSTFFYTYSYKVGTSRCFLVKQICYSATRFHPTLLHASARYCHPLDRREAEAKKTTWWRIDRPEKNVRLVPAISGLVSFLCRGKLFTTSEDSILLPRPLSKKSPWSTSRERVSSAAVPSSRYIPKTLSNLNPKFSGKHLQKQSKPGKIVLYSSHLFLLTCFFMQRTVLHWCALSFES